MGHLTGKPIRPDWPAAWNAVRDRLRRAASAENVVAMDPDIAALRADLGEELGTL